ncbi:Hypothetical protein NTJ_06737 [Nesidiocoris tenuis]|uniref:Uncharacterized protein n=1 Tax=Nesidiocoris tenuis TaxID=355587 RepID=A0ABN7ANX6_9HEMI|nr:Hypothetical protein NTJ_06737 [Nesidiocoris tenuis]
MPSLQDRIEDADQVDEPVSIVSVGVENAMRAGLSYSVCQPSVLLRMWNFQRVLTGRLVFKLTSAEIGRTLKESELLESTDETQKLGLPNLDLPIVQTRLLKRALTIHPLHSKLFASLVTEPNRYKVPHQNVSNIKKLTEKVCSFDTTLIETIATNRQLFNDKLETSEKYSAFIASSSAEIAELKEVQGEQVDDEDSRRLVRKEKMDCLFLAEICSRLMPHIILDSPELIEACAVSSEALIELSG